MATNRDEADRLVLAAIRLTRTLQWLGREGTLSPAQSGVLIVIVHAGRIVARDLAAHQRVTPATMSRLLNHLERRKLIQRKADKEDARLQWIMATSVGAALIAHEHEERIAPLAKLMRGQKPAERECLMRAAGLIESMTADLARLTE